jgi:hypothetical protein
MGAERERLRAAWKLRNLARRGGPSVDMDVRFRAKAVVVRKAIPATCERCGVAMCADAEVRLEPGADAGRYPSPPLGTIGYRCACGHVEYIRDDRLRTRAALRLVNMVRAAVCPGSS